MAKCLSLLTKAGKGAWITQVDAADAYKQLYVRYEDLHQQCLEVINEEGQKEYYIEYCACFGSIYGNDIYSAFGNAHCMCLAMAAKLPYLRVYVDNYINITPPQGLDREKSYERAKEKLSE